VASDLNFDVETRGEHLQLPLFPDGPPPTPDSLSPGQAARLADVLTYIHERLSDLAIDGQEPEESELKPLIEVPWERWQNILLLQRDLARWLRQIADLDGPADDE
jgi:hypothetical protein